MTKEYQISLAPSTAYINLKIDIDIELFSLSLDGRGLE
jgi:hypothetical protein